MSNILAYTTPISESNEYYLCDVRVVDGMYRNNHFQEQYDKEFFKNCPYGATLALFRYNGIDTEIVTPTKETLKEFNLQCSIVVNYNDITKNIVTLDGEIYNLNDCLFTKYNRETTFRIYEAINKCENFHMQLLIRSGKIYDIGLYVNKKPEDMNYNCILHRGFVPASRELLKRTINMTKEDIDMNQKLNQDAIDDLLRNFGI